MQQREVLLHRVRIRATELVTQAHEPPSRSEIHIITVTLPARSLWCDLGSEPLVVVEVDPVEECLPMLNASARQLTWEFLQSEALM